MKYWNTDAGTICKRCLAAAIMIFLCICGCGKKEWPSAPWLVPPQPVTDLRSQMHGNEVELIWSVPPAHSGSEPVERVGLFRASELISETCNGCPVMFSRLADIPLSANPVMMFRDTLEKEHRYRYKVICYSRNGAASRDSNILDIRVESE